MPVLPKPTTQLDWTDGAPAKVVEPSAAKKLLGWVALERPPFEFMNFLFFNTDEWIKYLESVTDNTLGALTVVVDAGGGGSFLTLQAAHDDAGTVAGTKILIVSDLSLATTTNITKPDIEIEMTAGKRFLKAGGAPATNFTGVIIGATADRVRLRGLGFGRSATHFSGAGDKGIEVAAGATDVAVLNPVFGPTNTTNLDDNGTTTLIANAQIMAS